MIMLPDDAIDRINAGCKSIGDLCKQQGIEQWEIVAYQSYGHQLDIEAGKISLAAGGGEGGYGIRVVEGGRFGYAYLVDVASAGSALRQALDVARASPSIEGFVLPNAEDAPAVDGLFDQRIHGKPDPAWGGQGPPLAQEYARIIQEVMGVPATEGTCMPVGGMSRMRVRFRVWIFIALVLSPSLALARSLSRSFSVASLRGLSLCFLWLVLTRCAAFSS